MTRIPDAPACAPRFNDKKFIKRLKTDPSVTGLSF